LDHLFSCRQELKPCLMMIAFNVDN